jgi:tetratricopeptide (TPR) repeat protein
MFSNPELQVFLIDASSEDHIKEEYQTIIRSRGDAYRSFDHAAALQWLSSLAKPWLVIADNADDPRFDLHPFIPRNPRGHFIITSRNANQELMAITRTHHIAALGTDDSTRLLLAMSRYEPSDANRRYATEIVTALGCLPLAVVQAAGYIFKHKCLSSYLEIYRESREELLSQRAKELPHDYNLSVATTLEMSFTKLSIHTKAILRIFSFLHYTSIPHRIIVEAAKNKFFYASGKAKEADDERLDEIKQESTVLCELICPKGRWSEVEFNKIIEPCFQYSLLQSTTSVDDEKFYSMHILVQSWLQMQPAPDAEPSSARLARRMLFSLVKEDSYFQYLALHLMILPHLKPIAGTSLGVATDEVLMYYVLKETGDFIAAHTHLMAYISMAKNKVRWDAVEWLHALCERIYLLYILERYREALEAGKEAIELCIKALGREDPLTLTSMSNLALNYGNIEENNKAREMNEEVLAIRKQVLGAEHPQTLISMNNLALDYSSLGWYNRSREMNEETLSLQRRVLGPEHPDTLTSMSNLASNYSYLGWHDKSREMNEETLSLERRVLGPEHPHTLTSMNNLASNYSYLGWHDKSREMNEETLSLRRRVLGPEHPDTLKSMSNLASNYSDLGWHDKSREMNEETLSLWRRVLGPEHPDTLISMSKLASNYSDLGWHDKSREMNEETLSLRRRVLGPEHPHTLKSMSNLASNYSYLGWHDKSREMNEETLSLRRRVLGPEHPDTLISMSKLA